MAKPHDGPAYLVPFLDKHGGGKVLMRYLPMAQERRLYEQHKDNAAALADEIMLRGLAEVSADIAAGAGIHDGELSEHGLVPVDDNRPGRVEVWESLGPKRRKCVELAWASRNTVDEADQDFFLAGVSDIV
ncbi:MAG: hypothetical protein Q8R92_21085 [Deltaproteobacteria bacterium]|nr:hypothetical protein [Deltaproteobacteria bacterium]